jgi:hypothetical protein
MAGEKIRVGIIGANAHYGWSMRAHLPALRAMPAYELTAVCLPKSAGRPRRSRRGWIGVGRAGLDAQATNQTQVLPEPSMGEGNTAVEAPSFRAGRTSTLPHLLDGHRHNRPNDLAIDRQGRIWFTDPYGQGLAESERELDHTSVLRLTPQPNGDWQLERMTYNTSAPNGILFSQDERTLYVVQSDYEGVRDLRAYPLQDDDTLGQCIVLHVAPIRGGF